MLLETIPSRQIQLLEIGVRVPGGEQSEEMVLQLAALLRNQGLASDCNVEANIKPLSI